MSPRKATSKPLGATDERLEIVLEHVQSLVQCAVVARRVRCARWAAPSNVIISPRRRRHDEPEDGNVERAGRHRRAARDRPESCAVSGLLGAFAAHAGPRPRTEGQLSAGEPTTSHSLGSVPPPNERDFRRDEPDAGRQPRTCWAQPTSGSNRPGACAVYGPLGAFTAHAGPCPRTDGQLSAASSRLRTPLGARRWTATSQGTERSCWK
jgi:hypothetical protein